MRKSAIIPDNLEAIFLREAERTGLITKLPSDADDLYDPIEVELINKFHNSELDKLSDLRQKVYQITLLFDEIFLDKAPDIYNYQRLQNAGNVSIIPFNTFWSNDPTKKVDHNLYVRYLKPAILPVLEHDIRRHYPSLQYDVELCGALSAVYDKVLLDKRIPIKYIKIIEDMRKLIINNYSIDKRLRFFKFALMGLPDALSIDKMFLTDLSTTISLLYQSLCWELQVSSERDAAIINSEFNLEHIGIDATDAYNSITAYQILRVECQRMIGSLPKVNSLQEVFTLKEKRHHDLHNLRQELSHLEYEIRNNHNQTQRAIERAADDVSKASKALCVGNTIGKISKWTNLLLIPSSAASLFLQKPEIVCGSAIATIIGRLATATSDVIANRNKWFELII